MNKFWRFISVAHRYIGLFFSLILIIIAITGIALNHTDDLTLDSQMVESEYLLDWYKIKKPTQRHSFASQHHWLSQIEQSIYFNQQLLIRNKHVVGMVETNHFIVVGLQKSLLLLSLEGDIIEQLPFDSIQQIAQQQHMVIIRTDHKILASDDGLLSWVDYDAHNIAWSTPSPLPQNLSSQLSQQYRSTIIPMERVILDLHSGRFFGNLGVLMVDLSGIALILLAFSGVFVWLRNTLRRLKRPS